MSKIVRASLVSVLAAALSACAAHADVQTAAAPAPPAPQEAPPPPPPPAPAPPPPAAQPAPPAAPAAPAVHPAYLHALSDLRNARGNLERKGGDKKMKWDEHEGVVAIDKAIAEIKQAAIDDGKNLEDHPAIDAKEPRKGRLHKALDALRAAKKDVAEEEDNAYANGLKARALHHIDEAIRLTEDGVKAAEHDI